MGGRDQWPFLRISWIASSFASYLLSKGEIWFVKATHKRIEKIYQNNESCSCRHRNGVLLCFQGSKHFHQTNLSQQTELKVLCYPHSSFCFLRVHYKYSLRVKWVIYGHRPLYILGWNALSPGQ